MTPRGAPAPKLRPPTLRVRTWTIGLGFLLAGTLGAFVLGHLAAGALLVPAKLGREGVRHAPDLIGRSLDDAGAGARDAGAELDVLGIAYGEEADSGEVLFQYPPEGFPLEAGRPIEVLVSGGPGRRSVPELAGLPQSAALSMLEAAGIPVARVQAVSDDAYEEGTVVSSEPPASSPLGDGDSLVVAVSRGGGTVEVPDLTGKTLGEATSMLQGAGLRAGETTYEDQLGPGETIVVGQEPPAGGLARSGSTVNLRLGGSGEVPPEDAPPEEAPPEEAPPEDAPPEDAPLEEASPE